MKAFNFPVMLHISKESSIDVCETDFPVFDPGGAQIDLSDLRVTRNWAFTSWAAWLPLFSSFTSPRIHSDQNTLSKLTVWEKTCDIINSKSVLDIHLDGQFSESGSEGFFSREQAPPPVGMNRVDVHSVSSNMQFCLKSIR